MSGRQAGGGFVYGFFQLLALLGTQGGVAPARCEVVDESDHAGEGGGGFGQLVGVAGAAAARPVGGAAGEGGRGGEGEAAVGGEAAAAGQPRACADGNGLQAADALHGFGQFGFEVEGAVGQLAGGAVVDAVWAAHYRVGCLKLVDAFFPGRGFGQICH